MEYGIKCNVPVPEELLPNIMATELKAGALADKRGTTVRLTEEW